MFPIVIAYVAYNGRHPRLQFVCVSQFVERGEYHDKSVMQQVFCHMVFLGVMLADVEKIWPIMGI